jgi:hypothetical protein
MTQAKNQNQENLSNIRGKRGSQVVELTRIELATSWLPDRASPDVFLLTSKQLQNLMSFAIAVVYFTAGECVPAATITHEWVSPSPLPSLLFEFLIDYRC